MPHIQNETHLLQSYDYVVIGGGVAGLVVANRLSEDNSTLLIAALLVNMFLLIDTRKLTPYTATSVLIIEAGTYIVKITKPGPFHDQETNRKTIKYSDSQEDIIEIPQMAGNAVNISYDWNLTYVPKPETNNRTIRIPQGKVVDGGSLLDSMVFDRGSVADYDRWESLGLERPIAFL
jgi:choline dehydrogenase-like flavoprotein